MRRAVITFYSVVFFVFGLIYFSLGQTKKEQIAMITGKLDSVSNLLIKERIDWKIESKNLNYGIDSIQLILESERQLFQHQKKMLSNDLDSTQKELKLVLLELKLNAKRLDEVTAQCFGLTKSNEELMLRYTNSLDIIRKCVSQQDSLKDIISSLNSKVPQEPKTTKIKLSKELLVNSVWEWHYSYERFSEWPDFTVKFTNQGNLEAHSTSYDFGESGMIFRGSYTLVNDSIVSGEYYLYSEYDDEAPRAKKFRANLIVNDNSFRFPYSLKMVGTTINIVLRSKILDAGCKRIICDREVITLGDKKGVTSVEVRLLSEPNVKSKILPFSFDEEPGEIDEFSPCPKGTELRLIARTKELQQLEGVENYWYFVELRVQDRGNVVPRYAWIFGNKISMEGVIAK